LAKKFVGETALFGHLADDVIRDVAGTVARLGVDARFFAGKAMINKAVMIALLA